jgi:hypothetical protein
MRPGLALEQELRRMTMGMTMGSTKFFLPTQLFYKWMKKNYGSRRVYSVGAGAGHGVKGLNMAGVETIGLDIFQHSKQEYPVLIADGTAYGYDEGSVVYVARPCHGNFFTDVVERALECKVHAILYVGLERNIEEDFGDYYDQFKKETVGVGEDGEGIWRLIPSISSTRKASRNRSAKRFRS